MYLEARVKSTTHILSKPNELGTSLGKLYTNDFVALVSLHKNGLDSYYRTANGGYINAADVVIDRDVEFSSQRVANHANQDKKNPFRRSFGSLNKLSKFLTGSAPSPTSSIGSGTLWSAGQVNSGTPTNSNSNYVFTPGNKAWANPLALKVLPHHGERLVVKVKYQKRNPID